MGGGWGGWGEGVLWSRNRYSTGVYLVQLIVIHQNNSSPPSLPPSLSVPPFFPVSLSFSVPLSFLLTLSLYPSPLGPRLIKFCLLMLLFSQQRRRMGGEWEE